jgi:4-aminobutyrate aminotransferase-like enzyme
MAVTVEDLFDFSDEHLEMMQRDARHVLGWRFQPHIVFERGEGVKLFDVDGNAYYDMSSGMMSLVIGHAHPELVDTIRSHAERLIHQASWFTNPWSLEYAELVASTLPGNLSVMNFAVTGSEANEIAMRMAIGASGKFELVSLLRGLHGGTLGVESLTTVGGARRSNLSPLMIPAARNAIYGPTCFRCPINLSYPSCDVACIEASEDRLEHLTSKEVAAIMAETVQVPGGMNVPPPEYLPKLKRLAERWGAYLILDEAQLAPARTGKMWAFEHYDVVPDMVTFGKGMSAGMAVTGVSTTPEIAEAARGKAGVPWAGTYSGDPLASAVALKQLQIVLRDNLAERAARLGEVLREKLERLKQRFECVGDVRGLGMYQMLDIVADRSSRKPDFAMTERIRFNAVREGAIYLSARNNIRICPPLTITEDELDDAIGRLERAMERAERGEPRELDMDRIYDSSSSLAHRSRDLRSG